MFIFATVKQVVFFEMFGSLRVRLAGGNANTGANAGASYSNTNNASSNANANLSSPQCFMRKEIRRKDLATWHKITNPDKGGW